MPITNLTMRLHVSMHSKIYITKDQQLNDSSLLEAGANPNMKKDQCFTALDI